MSATSTRRTGTRPVEDVIIHDLIPHIDALSRSRRAGARSKGCQWADLAHCASGSSIRSCSGPSSALAPSIKPMAQEPEVVREPFGNDSAYWDEVGPWSIVKQHASEIRGRTRSPAGRDQDPLLAPVTGYHGLLTSLGIEHQFAVVAGPITATTRSSRDCLETRCISGRQPSQNSP